MSLSTKNEEPRRIVPPPPALFFVLILWSLHSPGLLPDATAQVFTDRFVILDPLANSEPNDRQLQLLPGSALFASFSNYSGDIETHEWGGIMGGFAELARWSDLWSIALVGGVEMIADPFSDINFNPRAVYWEEGLMFALNPAPGPYGGQLGFVQRCKHDIDSYERFRSTGRSEERTLISSSLFARGISRPQALSAGSPFLVGGALRSDYYVIRYDRASDALEPASRPTFEDLHVTFGAEATVKYRPAGSVGAHLTGGVRTAYYSANDSEPEINFTRSVEGLKLGWYGIELGVDLFNADGNAFSLLLRMEEFYDDGVRPAPTGPRDASSLQIGLGIRPERAAW